MAVKKDKLYAKEVKFTKSDTLFINECTRSVEGTIQATLGKQCYPVRFRLSAQETVGSLVELERAKIRFSWMLGEKMDTLAKVGVAPDMSTLEGAVLHALEKQITETGYLSQILKAMPEMYWRKQPQLGPKKVSWRPCAIYYKKEISSIPVFFDVRCTTRYIKDNKFIEVNQRAGGWNSESFDDPERAVAYLKKAIQLRESYARKMAEGHKEEEKTIKHFSELPPGGAVEVHREEKYKAGLTGKIEFTWYAEDKCRLKFYKRRGRLVAKMQTNDISEEQLKSIMEILSRKKGQDKER